MKAAAVVTIAGGIGCGVAFWLFSLMFTRSTSKFNDASLIPLLVVFIGSFVLMCVFQPSAKSIVLAISIPTVLFNAYLLSCLLEEGRGMEWGYILTALKVVGAAAAGVFTGHCALREKRRSESDMP